MPGSERKVIIIAGPNGAGKTTFAREFLPNEVACPVFVTRIFHKPSRLEANSLI